MCKARQDRPVKDAGLLERQWLFLATPEPRLLHVLDVFADHRRVVRGICKMVPEDIFDALSYMWARRNTSEDSAVHVDKEGLGPPFRMVFQTHHIQLFILTRRNNHEPRGAAWYPLRYYAIVRSNVSGPIDEMTLCPPLTVKNVMDQISHSFHLPISMRYGLSMGMVVRTFDGRFRTRKHRALPPVCRFRDPRFG